MRDDKQYPYIKLTLAEPYPAFKIVRRIQDDGAAYFGPFRSGAARQLLKTASRIFGLRDCSSGLFRKRRQPCLNYYMKKCSSPCTGGISKRKYADRVSQAKEFFEAGPEKFMEETKERMKKASAKNSFELAAALRDRLCLIERSFDLQLKKPCRSSNKEALKELANKLGLSGPPLRIEAFDVSNTGPFQTVGAMAVFVNGEPHKAHYRKFKISTPSLPDDTAAIYEMVFRRYSGSLKKLLPFPDLVMIDGGAGQRGSAAKALEDAGAVHLKLISLAKKNEEIYVSKNEPPLVLPGDSKGLLLLRALRDEVHRFAVSYHRSRRRKAQIS